jgi:hypothetical protein
MSLLPTHYTLLVVAVVAFTGVEPLQEPVELEAVAMPALLIAVMVLLALPIPAVVVEVEVGLILLQKPAAAMAVKVWSLSAIPVLPHWAQAVLFLLIPVVVLPTWLTCSQHREHCLLLDQILVLLVYNIWSLLGAVVVLNVMVVVVELVVYLLEFV